MKVHALALAVLFTGAAFAQDATTTTPTTTPTPAKKRMGVNARQERQQQRIGEGVENGSLTAGEAAKLEKKETQLNKEEARFRKGDNGKLTPAEKAKLEKQENKLSKDIYHQEHDAQVQNTNPKSEIEKRDREQQKRIGEGIENGSLTAKEAGKLETKEAKLQKQEHRMRADGDMTQQEKAKVNREQNQLSRDIYKQKHDKQRRRK
jgi:hypothetical protein